MNNTHTKKSSRTSKQRFTDRFPNFRDVVSRKVNKETIRIVTGLMVSMGWTRISSSENKSALYFGNVFFTFVETENDLTLGIYYAIAPSNSKLIATFSVIGISYTLLLELACRYMITAVKAESVPTLSKNQRKKIIALLF